MEKQIKSVCGTFSLHQDHIGSALFIRFLIKSHKQSAFFFICLLIIKSNLLMLLINVMDFHQKSDNSADIKLKIKRIVKWKSSYQLENR